MPKGKVITGYSKPYVALYNQSGQTVTYTGGMVLARGVSVSIQPTVANDNNFYADNVEAETAGGIFTGGEATITVDGLLATARKTIWGLPEEKPLADMEGVSLQTFGEKAAPPYMGFGCLIRYMSGGVTTYEPLVLTKIKFNMNNTEAATQEEDIDWQTEELTARIMRDDTADKNWKLIATEQATEEEAENVLKAMLGITAQPAQATQES